ncbi:MAG: RNA polymerase sigma factor [Oscillospiraceae bacterium]|nr:RNA polymerase sigma factor [Oscillospiraceae bacterium]
MIEIHENVESKQRQERIYIEFKDRVTRYVRGKISNIHDAEDIVSDVFVKAFNGLAGYDESKSSLSTWIYTITRNTVTDYFRAAKRFCEIPEELCPEDDTEEILLNEESLEQLADALLQLDERSRDIIVLHYYSGKSLKETAAVMGISYSYVKLLHANALKALRKIIDG